MQRVDQHSLICAQQALGAQIVDDVRMQMAPSAKGGRSSWRSGVCWPVLDGLLCGGGGGCCIRVRSLSQFPVSELRTMVADRESRALLPSGSHWTAPVEWLDPCWSFPALQRRRRGWRSARPPADVVEGGHTAASKLRGSGGQPPELRSGHSSLPYSPRPRPADVALSPVVL